MNILDECARIRIIELSLIDLYKEDLIQSPMHMSIGQETVAVGVCHSLTNNDRLFATYRSHAWYLAKGGDLYGFYCELMGRADGVCKGKGGSMHLADVRVGFMGTSAIVGGTISHAVGAALALRQLKKEGNLTVSVFGDGAMDQGVYHESLNFASNFNLPVVFVLEDNSYAVNSKSENRQGFDAIKLAESYNIQIFELQDCSDPIEVSNMMEKIYEQVRITQKPAWVRLKTQRYLTHVGIEIYDRKQNKLVFSSHDNIPNDLIAQHIEANSPKIVAIRNEIKKDIERARLSKFPSIASLLEDI